MDDNNNIKYSRPVPPFVRYCSAIIPTAFDDSLSYYEALCALWKWLQDNLVNVVNNNAAATEEYIKLVKDLEKYVHDYFDNLDVQEEINNKLDAMVADGTLPAIIENYVGETVQYIFPENPNIQSQTGDTCLIQAYGKNILIDCSSALGKAKLYAFLYRHGVNHLDYIIISHYHSDHEGNFVSLINDGYIDTNTAVYLPASPSEIDPVKWSYEVGEETIIKTALTNANIPYIEPDEGDVLSFDTNFSIKFLNCDVEQLIEADYTEGNDLSMMCLIKHYENQTLTTGDAGGKPLKRLYTDELVTGTLDLFKVNHHGVNQIGENSMSINFLQSTMPVYAYIPLNSYIHGQNAGCANATFSWLKDNDCKIYAQFVSKEDTIFESSKFNFYNVAGTPLYSLSNVRYIQTIYVDPDGADTGDGTQSNPFKDLPIALGMCEKENGVIEIHLADGNYGVKGNTLLSNLSRCDHCTVRINGNENDNTAVVINVGILARQCNLEINDCTIYATSYQALYAVKSRIRLKNCVITYVGDTTNDGIFTSETELNLNGCTFDTLKYAISSHNDNITVNKCSFTNCMPILGSGSNISISSDTTYSNLTSTNNRVVEKTGYENFVQNNYALAYNGDSVTSGTITLTKDTRYYNKARIVTGFPPSNTWFESEICAYNNTSFGNNTYTFMTASGTGTITFNTSNPTTATISSPITLRHIYLKIDETGRM